MSPSPSLSVIIPTHNRCDLLDKNLDALLSIPWPATDLEIIVVADSCEDDTEKVVKFHSKESRCPIRYFGHEAKNPSATRNLGATHAKGRVLLFLDDDNIAQPGLLQAHMNEHQVDNRVILGYSKAIIPENPSLWQLEARLWWEDRFKEMAHPGYRFNYCDFFSGNTSLSASLFQKTGGFDLSLKRLEDYELGIRLLRLGARFGYVPEAVGHHHDNTDLEKWLRRTQHEGEAEVQIAQRYPELSVNYFGHSLNPDNRWQRLIRKRAFASPQEGTRLEKLVLKMAKNFELLRLLNLRRKCISILREYNYWRGVATSIGSWKNMHNLLQEVPIMPAMSENAPIIDMSNLPPKAELQDILEGATQLGLRLALEGIEILTVPPQPGSETLRKKHLESMLQQLKEQEFVPAIIPQLKNLKPKGGVPC